MKIKRVSLLFVFFTLLFAANALCQEEYLSKYPVWRSGLAYSATSIALGDIDSDGDLDLVFGYANHPNEIYLNNNGIVEALPEWTLGDWNNYSFSVALGDIDGDGDLDLVCGNRDQSNTLYLNENGAFEYYPSWSSGPMNDTRDVVLADIDGDGDLDLVCGNYGQNNTLYINEAGMFQTEPAWSSVPNDYTSEIALGDIDGDGDLDLVCANWGQSTLYINNDGALEQTPAWYSGRADYTRAVVLGDIDGDGDLDLAFGNINQRNSLYLNNDGVLDLYPAWYSGPSNATESVDFGDIDKDGDLDLACGNTHSSNTVYINNNGELDVTPAWSSEPINVTVAIALGDIDGDGALDLACGNSQSQSNTLYANIGCMLNKMPTWSSVPTNITNGIALGDIDGDGDLDLVCGNNGVNAYYMNNDGLLEQVRPNISAPSNDTKSVALGDIDGDGDLDLVCGNNGRNTLYLNSAGVLRQIPDWNSLQANDTRSVALGDIDGDGDLDLVCGNYDNSNNLYKNEDGVLEQTPSWSSAQYFFNTTSVALGDIDNDGDLDLLCGNYWNLKNSLHMNDDGVLNQYPRIVGQGNHTLSIALGDIDGDGDLDLACGNSDESNTLYLNNGGAFDPVSVWYSGPGNNTWSTALNDIDGDGDLDLVFGNYNGANTIYVNENGVFAQTPSWSPEPVNATTSMALGDIDDDGDIDLMCGNAGSNNIYLGLMTNASNCDLLSPCHQLPNNSACLRHVNVEERNPASRQVIFSAFDIESDPIWLVAEYQYKGEHLWHSAIISGQTRAIGPFVTSPTGVVDSTEWDTSLLPFDQRDVILRLRAIEFPELVSFIQNIPNYLKEVGVVTPYRPLISTSSELAFPAVTIGDTTSVEMSIANNGTVPLEIANIDLPSMDVWFEDLLPLIIPPSESHNLTLDFSPNRDNDIEGNIIIYSDDPFALTTDVVLTAEVRPLEFTQANIYPTGEILQGTALSISITMQDFVCVDSALVFYREGGRSYFDVKRLQRIDDPVNEQYYGIVSSESIMERGIEYFIQVYNGNIKREGPLRVLRTRVESIEFENTLRSNQYGLISLPLEMEGPILGVLSDDLGGLDITNWRLWKYDRRASIYVEVPNDTISHFDHGLAYWLITREEHKLDTGPAEGLSTPTDSAFALILEPGYNLIGNPFAFDVAWDSVLVDTLGSEPLTVAEAEGAAMEPIVSWVVGLGYDFDNRILEPFDGYWIKNLLDKAIVIQIPPKAVHEVIPADEPQLLAAELTEGWSIGIKASCGEICDGCNILGIRNEARSAWDSNDLSEPPMAPGQAISLYFPHGDWSRHPGAYTKDIRGDYEELEPGRLFRTEIEDDIWGHIWRFDVAKSFSGGSGGDEVTLEFSAIEKVPATAVVYLVDRELERLIDLRESPTYSFFLGQRDMVVKEDEARFAVLVGSEEFVSEHEDELPTPPATTFLHQNYPNPFNPATVIRYEVARAGEVTIVVYDVTGSLVKVLERRHREPGRYEVGWEGENERGAQVTSGIYFYRLSTAHTSQTRKMILLR